MHKPRLGVVVIDCQGEDPAAYEAFWAAALGRERETDPIDPKYRDLRGPEAEIGVLAPAVDHPPRVHFDIETDDIDAEVARLE
ncbi:VOC family protein [Stappia sp. ES.058]|uniref:VOC family protein n=1 Tax=Stappia sp. ES.058 TaxID=1881061 RepID=UPI0018D4A5FF|nr:VOC family protein [Stappia sp. ES.058]